MFALFFASHFGYSAAKIIEINNDLTRVNVTRRTAHFMACIVSVFRCYGHTQTTAALSGTDQAVSAAQPPLMT